MVVASNVHLLAYFTVYVINRFILYQIASHQIYNWFKKMTTNLYMKTRVKLYWKNRHKLILSGRTIKLIMKEALQIWRSSGICILKRWTGIFILKRWTTWRTSTTWPQHHVNINNFCIIIQLVCRHELIHYNEALHLYFFNYATHSVSILSMEICVLGYLVVTMLFALQTFQAWPLFRCCLSLCFTFNNVI